MGAACSRLFEEGPSSVPRGWPVLSVLGFMQGSEKMSRLPLTIEQPAYFGRLSTEETTHWWSHGMWDFAEALLAPWIRRGESLRVVDVGCGTGLNSRRLASLSGVGMVVGLDRSPIALSFATRQASPGKTVPWMKGDALKLPFPDRCFDLVVSFDVIQHLEPADRVNFLRELVRVTREGGRLLLRSNGRGARIAEGTALVAFRIHELRDLLVDSGWCVERATHGNFTGSLLQEIRGRFLPGRHVAHPGGAGLCLKTPPPMVNSVMRWIAWWEARLVGSLQINLPFGHSTFVLARREAS